jgi:hypothetical protein
LFGRGGSTGGNSYPGICSWPVCLQVHMLLLLLFRVGPGRKRPEK